MNGSPFANRQPLRRSLLDWILRRRPAANAWIELANLLGRNGVQGVTQEDVARTSREYGFNIQIEFRRELENLYRDYLVFCLKDRHLSDQEIADLAWLASLFRLENGTRDAIQRTVARQLYFKSVSEVLADGTIDDQEREFLRKLQEQLAIPEGDAQNILAVRERQMQSRVPRKP
jgi:hypothetical protein